MVQVVNPDQVTDAIVGVRADKRKAKTIACGVTPRFTDSTTADEAELLNNQRQYKLTKALPLGEVAFDDVQLATCLSRSNRRQKR